MSKNKRIGLFGGSFDPPHSGHLQALKLCIEQCDLDKVYIIPAYQTPDKPLIKTSPSSRMKMVEEVFSPIPIAEVLDIEIKKKKITRTINTIKELQLKGELFLIIGSDWLEGLPQWKDFEGLIDRVNVVVVQRGEDIFTNQKKCVDIFKPYVKRKFKNYWLTKSGTRIISVENRLYSNVKSSSIKNKIRMRTPLTGDVPDTFDVHKYYKHLPALDIEQINKNILKLLQEKGGINSKIFQFQGGLFEYILITSGLNTRHVKALSESIVQYVQNSYGIEPIGVEGQGGARWVVIDYDFLIIHVFYDYLRGHYNLEDIWKQRAFK